MNRVIDQTGGSTAGVDSGVIRAVGADDTRVP